MTVGPSGVVETRADGRVLTIHIDRREKHNAKTPAKSIREINLPCTKQKQGSCALLSLDFPVR